MFHRVFIGIGSNLGKRRAHYQRALGLIAALPKTRVVKQSSLYESEPIGEAKNWYVNGVIEIETAFSPVQLLRRLQEIEQGMGRKRFDDFVWSAAGVRCSSRLHASVARSTI